MGVVYIPVTVSPRAATKEQQAAALLKDGNWGFI